MTFGCHSQHNTYGAHRKIWALNRTNGELTSGKVRSSREVPKGLKLNNTPLTHSEALAVALRQPGGGVIHALDEKHTIYNVYSEQSAVHFKELLSQIKRRNKT